MAHFTEVKAPAVKLESAPRPGLGLPSPPPNHAGTPAGTEVPAIRSSHAPAKDGGSP